MGRKPLIAACTITLALIIILWQHNISAQSDAPQLACEPGLTTWLSGTSPAHTPVLLYWDGRAVGGGSSDEAGRWALPLRVGNERSGFHMVEVRSRNNRALVGAFKCAVGGGIPTPAPFIEQPTPALIEQPTLEPSPTSEPEPTVLTDFTPEPTEVSESDVTPEPTNAEDVTPEPTDAEDVTPEPTDAEDATPEPTPSDLGIAPDGIVCPQGYPVKGADNDGEKIYRVPTDDDYDATIPERCFTGTIEAQAAGYHAAQ